MKKASIATVIAKSYDGYFPCLICEHCTPSGFFGSVRQQLLVYVFDSRSIKEGDTVHIVETVPPSARRKRAVPATEFQLSPIPLSRKEFLNMSKEARSMALAFAA